MKIRNLAFCGVMASILTGWGALAADGDTVIASKAYVDAMDATKQNKLTSTGANANLVVDSNHATGNVITDISASDGTITIQKGTIAATDYIKNTDTVNNETKTNVLEFANDSDHAPSITAVKNMKTTSINATTSGASDNKLPTEKAVRSAIDTASSSIEGNFEDAHVAGDTKADAITAQTGDADGMAAIHNTVADEEDIQKIPRNYNIQKGIAYMTGTGIENHTSGVDASSITTRMTNEASDPSSYADSWSAILEARTADDYVPTVATVEKRVRKAVGDGITNRLATQGEAEHYVSEEGLKLEGDAGVDATGSNLSTIDTSVEAGNSDWDDYIPTLGVVKKVANQVATNASNISTNASAISTNASAITTLNGNDSTTGSVLKNIKDNAQNATYTNTTSGLSATNLKAAVDELASEKLDKNTAITASTSNSVVTYDTNGLVTGGVSLDETLRGVNAEAASSSLCSAANPCVLTYLGGTGANAKYRWTNMDTEGVSAASIN